MDALVAFGTETGTAEDFANDIADTVCRAGGSARVVDLDDLSLDDLPIPEVFVVVTATFGNGDAPANAEAMLSGLRKERPDLTGQRFAVLALGDSTYPNFARCGRRFDEVLEELGGERFVDLHVVDDGQRSTMEAFRDALLTALGRPIPGPAKAAPTEVPSLWARLKAWFSGKSADPRPHRDAPGSAVLVSSERLSGEGSTKDTRHYVLDLGIADHGLQPGDSVAVLPVNPPALVSDVLEALGASGDESVSWRASTTTLRSALADACLRRVSAGLLEALGDTSHREEEALRQLQLDHHVLHVLRRFGPPADVQALLDQLHPLASRRYSVANHPDGALVELCVETLRYEVAGVATEGVASCWLAERLEPGARLRWYPTPQPRFHRPATGPLILVATGTGIAPFRGFLQAEASAPSGRDVWLVFGHRNEACDALYRDELEGFLADGVLSRVTYAWSRDTAEKVYVQHQLVAEGDEVWAWLERGATVMVCGDAVGMAPGVRDAFGQLAAAHGQDRDAWFAGLREAGRYLEDVY